MNKLEKLLIKQQWVRTRNAFTTICNGYGFIVYENQLIGLSKEVTEEQLRIHNMKPPEVIGVWIGYYRTKRMFTIPTSIDFVVEVIGSALNLTFLR